MTKKEIEAMTDEELDKLKLQRTKNGNFSRDANLAYEEIRRRKGITHYIGQGGNRCGKRRDDFDYYGSAEDGNR